MDVNHQVLEFSDSLKDITIQNPNSESVNKLENKHNSEYICGGSKEYPCIFLRSPERKEIKARQSHRVNLNNGTQIEK